jgi:hypothetical protein
MKPTWRQVPLGSSCYFEQNLAFAEISFADSSFAKTSFAETREFQQSFGESISPFLKLVLLSL